MIPGGKGRITTPKKPKTSSTTTTKKRKPTKTSKHPPPELLSLLSTAASSASSFLLRHEAHLRPTQILSLESLLSTISSRLPSPSPSLSFFPFPPAFDPQWPRFFRMSQQTFSHLLHALLPSLSSSLPSSFPPDSALAATLLRLSHAVSYKSLARRFAFPSSADACRIFYTVCKAINDKLGTLVEFRENLERIVVGFGWISLPNCCGVLGFGRFDIDGDLLGLNGSLLVQALVDSEGRFLDISAGWPSTMKPQSILYQTKLFVGVEESRELLNGPAYELGDGNYIPQYILGDSCFPLMPWLITPYVRNNEEDSFSSAEKEFNVVHSRAMRLVGTAFARVKLRWQLLGRRWREECIEFLPYVIVTGCLLHNFLIKFSEPLPDDDVGCLKEEEFPIFEGEVDETGRGIRDFLAEHLSRAFINTELYARVSVAVLFYKLADLAGMVGSANADEDCQPALDSGKLFLLELLDFVVNDKDLAKELYKKYSGIHRRKIRAWQMICVLSRFVDQEIVGKVTSLLHISLYRNNLPAVRQYLETFAINIYLKFPSLVGEQLVPILQDYDMRPQALSSYVFIAANIILHASKEVQSRHLDKLFPPIVPLLTSHHHSLRGFTQLLVFQVLNKLFPTLESRTSKIMPLEKRCFEELKSYLAKNSDCARLRASMEGYLDAYNPKLSIMPAGIFVNRVEELEFECVPTSLMEQLLNFLNDVREDLRCSMAKDAVTIKNEKLKIGEDPDSVEISDADKEKSHTQLAKDSSLDFQKKITPSKHVKKETSFSSFLGDREPYKQLLEMEKEDQLFDQALLSRSVAMERLRASRQQFVLVASLIDRIPNLAGLARTCEVFKASGLAIGDANVVLDKQFQLISVTAEKWVPIIEVPVNSVKHFLERKKHEGYSILGLEQTANSIPLDQYSFPKKTVLVLGREKEGIPVDIIHILDACVEIPQLGVVRSLNVHVSGAIALWEYTRQHRLQ